MVQLQRDGVRWETTPDFQSILDEVMGQPGEVVKETPAKLVSLVDCRGRRFFVKRYRYAAVPLRPYKYWFQSSQPRQEWDLALAMDRKGIPIVRHVAMGERWERGGLREGILITEAFPGIPVKEAGSNFADNVLSVVQRMHQAGAIQHDLHGANILVNPETGDVRLVDLHGIILKDHVSEAEKAENLARLRKFQEVNVSPEIEAMGYEMRKQMHYRRSFRAWKANREFAKQRLGCLVWQVRLEKLDAEVESILRDPDHFLNSASDKLKKGRSSTVVAQGHYVIKRYNFKKPLNLLKDLFRPSRSWSSFRKAYHLESAGIRTAAPIAAANRRVCGFITQSYFVMERIEDAVSLRDYGGDVTSTVGKVAELIADMHEQGLSHRDLKTANILFDRLDQPVLIDLDGLSYEDKVSKARVRADLRRLRSAAESHPQWHPTLAARFLRHYCRKRRLTPRQILADK